MCYIHIFHVFLYVTLTMMSYAHSACDCDAAGISDSGGCSDEGQCNCKANVAGMTCSQCRDGYWNLTGDNDLGCQGKMQ